jgi:2'-5' RNA ligase
MQKIRSFIAIPIAPAIRKAADRLVQQLQRPQDRMKWVPNEHLHLTLKFLGDVDNTEIPQLCDVIRHCCQPLSPFPLDVRGAGGFPTAERARVVWAGIAEGGEALVPLVGALETHLAELGFKPEARDYVPHLTLGRARGGSRRGDPDLAARIDAARDFELGRMEADRVCLFASYLDKQGPTYHVMATIPLE